MLRRQVSVCAALARSGVPSLLTLPAVFLTSTRKIGGLQNSGTSIPISDIKICDLSKILSDATNNSTTPECKEKTLNETNPQYLTLEIQRRMRRIERLVKAAPYAGGPFIVPALNEARTDLNELEQVVKLFKDKLGEEYCEKFAEKAEKIRDDAKEVEYDADLI